MSLKTGNALTPTDTAAEAMLVGENSRSGWNMTRTDTVKG